MVRIPLSAVVLGLFLLCETAAAAAPDRGAGDTLSAAAQSISRSPATAADSSAAQPPLRIEPAGIVLGRGILREPLGLDADNRGFVYVADAMAGKVYRYGRDGAAIEFDTPPRTASLYPIDVAVFGPYVYVLDYDVSRVLRYDHNGAYLDILLSFNAYERVRPVSISVGGGGRIVTTDVENHSVIVWTPLLDIEFAIGEYGWMEGAFNRPVKATFVRDDRIAVAESGNRRVQLFSASGTYEGVLKPAGGGSFASPRSVAEDGAGNLFVSDTAAGKIMVFARDGTPIAALDAYDGKGIVPAALAIDWDGYLYVADLASRSILLFRLLYLP